MAHFRPAKGFTLIEMSIVMALIGLTSVIAAVYVSSSETELLRLTRNLRFDLELARQAAVNRNVMVFVTNSYENPALDCNDDGLLDDRDICYLIYEDRDGNGVYTPGADPSEEIKTQMLSASVNLVNVEGAGQTWFSPFGGSNGRKAKLQAAIARDSSLCSDRCLLYSYAFSVSAAGRIELSPKEETVVDCTYCNSCGDCS